MTLYMQVDFNQKQDLGTIQLIHRNEIENISKTFETRH